MLRIPTSSRHSRRCPLRSLLHYASTVLITVSCCCEAGAAFTFSACSQMEKIIPSSMIKASSIMNKHAQLIIKPRNTISTTEIFSLTHKDSEIATNTEVEQDNDNSNRQSMSTAIDRPLLAIIDVITIILFAGIGKASHTSTESALQNIQAVLVTAMPFIVSWFGTAPLTGIYDNLKSTTKMNKREIIKNSIAQTTKGWVIAIPLGCVIRGIIKGYVPPLPFIVVTMVATWILLGGVRIVYALIEDKSFKQ